MSNFRVGQKIVCIRDWEPWQRAIAPLDGVVLPEMGVIYTVREVGTLIDLPCVWLNEVRNELDHYNGMIYEQGWDPKRFKPVVERKTDISQFQAMLNYQPKIVVIS